MSEHKNLRDYINSDEFKKTRERTGKKKFDKAARDFYSEQLDKSIDQEIVDENLKNLKRDTIAAEKKDRYTRKRSEIDLRDELSQAGNKFFVLSIIASIISVIMSCAGISHADTPTTLLAAFTGHYCVYTWLMLLVQSSVIIYNFYSYALKKYHSTKETYINCFRFIVMAASIYYNYQFIITIIPESTGSMSGAITAAILAAGPDFISNLFGATAVDMKYKVYKENEGFLADIKMILFGGIMHAIKVAAQKKREQYYPDYKKDSDIFSVENAHYEAVKILIKKGVRPGSTIRRSDVDYSRSEWRNLCDELKQKGFAKVENQSTIVTRDLREFQVG